MLGLLEETWKRGVLQINSPVGLEELMSLSIFECLIQAHQ